MKHSIDFHNNKLSGWVENPSAVKSIRLYRSDTSFIEATISSVRLDVVDAGLSDNKICGFVFPDEINIEKENGNFLLVKIETDKKTYSKSVFIGDKNKWKKKFEDFQVTDRRDFTIQEGSAAAVFKKYSDIIAFKMLLIRLRRGKRAFGWRGSFSGNAYPEMEQDWLCFKGFYENNFYNIKDILTARSLWSVIETYADFGSDIERACALSLSNYMYQERFAQTFRRVFDFQERKEIQLRGQTDYGGNLLSNQLALDDSYDVFLTRNIEVLELSPIIKKTFGVVFLESLSSELSIVYFNKKYSPYFSEAFNYYKVYFENYIKNVSL